MGSTTRSREAGARPLVSARSMDVGHAVDLHVRARASMFSGRGIGAAVRRVPWLRPQAAALRLTRVRGGGGAGSHARALPSPLPTPRGRSPTPTPKQLWAAFAPVVSRADVFPAWRVLTAGRFSGQGGTGPPGQLRVNFAHGTSFYAPAPSAPVRPLADAQLPLRRARGGSLRRRPTVPCPFLVYCSCCRGGRLPQSPARIASLQTAATFRTK